MDSHLKYLKDRLNRMDFYDQSNERFLTENVIKRKEKVIEHMPLSENYSQHQTVDFISALQQTIVKEVNDRVPISYYDKVYCKKYKKPEFEVVDR